MKLKILFQRVCNEKIPWDSVLVSDSLTKWSHIRNDLLSCSALLVDRWYHVLKNVSRVEVHGFCDACPWAYGGCAYIRVVDKDGNINTSLIAAKSRVSPVKG